MATRILGFVLATCIGIGLAAGVAHAKGEYARSGIHVAVQGVVAIPLWQSELQTQVATAAPGTPLPELGISGGFDLSTGYRFHERVAAVTGFDWVSAYPIEIAGLDAGEAGNWMYYVGARLYLMTENIQPHVTLGMGAYHLDYVLPTGGVLVDGTSFSPRFGVGLDYYVDWRWGLTAQLDYVLGTRQLTDLDRLTVSFGAFYRF